MAIILRTIGGSGGSSGSLIITDGVNTVDPATTLEFLAGSITDAGAGLAQYDPSGIVTPPNDIGVFDNAWNMTGTLGSGEVAVAGSIALMEVPTVTQVTPVASGLLGARGFDPDTSDALISDANFSLVDTDSFYVAVVASVNNLTTTSFESLFIFGDSPTNRVLNAGINAGGFFYYIIFQWKHTTSNTYHCTC